MSCKVSSQRLGLRGPHPMSRLTPIDPRLFVRDFIPFCHVVLWPSRGFHQSESGMKHTACDWKAFRELLFDLVFVTTVIGWLSQTSIVCPVEQERLAARIGQQSRNYLWNQGILRSLDACTHDVVLVSDAASHSTYELIKVSLLWSFSNTYLCSLHQGLWAQGV